jgi:hypothetical protein
MSSTSGFSKSVYVNTGIDERRIQLQRAYLLRNKVVILVLLSEGAGRELARVPTAFVPSPKVPSFRGTNVAQSFSGKQHPTKRLID